MAKNDFHTIAFVILSHLYDCLKEGKKADIEHMDHVYMEISKSYWDFILNELYENGYIDGVIQYSHKTGKGILLTEDLRITMKGIEYLDSDKLIQKAKEFFIKATGWAEAIASLLNINSTL